MRPQGWPNFGGGEYKCSHGKQARVPPLPQFLCAADCVTDLVAWYCSLCLCDWLPPGGKTPAPGYGSKCATSLTANIYIIVIKTLVIPCMSSMCTGSGNRMPVVCVLLVPCEGEPSSCNQRLRTYVPQKFPPSWWSSHFSCKPSPFSRKNYKYRDSLNSAVSLAYRICFCPFPAPSPKPGSCQPVIILQIFLGQIFWEKLISPSLDWTIRLNCFV